MRVDVSGFNVLSVVGTGTDGVAYDAVFSSDASPVLLHRLSTTMSGARRAALRSRLEKLGESAERRILKVVACSISDGPSTVVTERAAKDAPSLESLFPLPAPEAFSLCAFIASTVSAGHRLGLTHGRLCPSQVFLDGPGAPRDGRLHVDFAGLATGFSPPKSKLDQACLPPEYDTDSQAADTFSVAAILVAALGCDVEVRDDLASLVPPATYAVIEQALSDDPAARPSFESLIDAIGIMVSHDFEEATTEMVRTKARARRDPFVLGNRIAGYELTEVLGHGGMGSVFGAKDPSTGDEVAIKVVSANANLKLDVVARLRKEARLLSHIKSPYVAGFLSYGTEDGHDYLIMERVHGRSLFEVVKSKGRLPPLEALAIVGDVARGLIDIHRAEMIHRDIKPANVMVSSTDDGPRAKLVDLGVARPIMQSESMDLTSAQGILGTVQYIAPEQLRNPTAHAPSSDIYSLGVTLYYAITGAAPFPETLPAAYIARQLTEDAPSIEKTVGDVAPAIAQLVQRLLHRHPDERPESAAALVDEIDDILVGPAKEATAHPATPAYGNASRVRRFTFEWDLESAPEALWPFVSDSDRINRAVGLPAVSPTFVVNDGRRKQEVRARAAGIDLAWTEHPFEWIENRRFGVLREYSEGPFLWFRSVVDLIPTNTGTRLVQVIELEPRGVVGRAAASLEVGLRGRQGLERIYRRIDSLVTASTNGSRARPFFEAGDLSREAEARLVEREAALVRAGVSTGIVDVIGRLVREGDSRTISRIRPLELASDVGVPKHEMVNALLHAAHLGIMKIRWDLLCPTCRIASDLRSTLAELKNHGHCDACDLDYELDLARSVELVFQVHPALRPNQGQVYCASSPGHSPHVKARFNVGAGERLKLDLALPAGDYRFCVGALAWNIDFAVTKQSPNSRWDLSLSGGRTPAVAAELAAGEQELVLHNPAAFPVTVRVEERAERSRAYTGARAAANSLFRRLFPHEVLTPGEVVGLDDVTVLAVRFRGLSALTERLGDPDLLRLLHEMYVALDTHFSVEGGGLIKILERGAVAVFSDADRALDAARRLRAPLSSIARAGEVSLSCGVHRGPAHVVTLNDRLDYFGEAVRHAWALAKRAGPDELIAAPSVVDDTDVTIELDGPGLVSPAPFVEGLDDVGLRFSLG